MPLYEYECTDCRNRFEVRQRVVDDPITVCPSCGGVTKRVLHPVGIIFKGSGWYVTDNRKSDSPSTSPSKDTPSADAKKDTTSGAGANGESKSSPGESKSTSGESKSTSTVNASS